MKLPRIIREIQPKVCDRPLCGTRVKEALATIAMVRNGKGKSSALKPSG